MTTRGTIEVTTTGYTRARARAHIYIERHAKRKKCINGLVVTHKSYRNRSDGHGASSESARRRLSETVVVPTPKGPCYRAFALVLTACATATPDLAAAGSDQMVFVVGGEAAAAVARLDANLGVASQNTQRPSQQHQAVGF